MSQIIVPVSSGSLPPTVPTSFVTDSGTVIPAANVVNVNGGTTTANNANGISVVANPTGSNNMVVELTNRQNGSVTTTNATPTTLISFAAAASATVYNVQVRIAAFDATDVAGAAYHIDAGARTTGAAVTIFPDPDFVDNEEAAMVSSDINILASGNNIIIQVTGITGKTIRWSGSITYIQVV